MEVLRRRLFLALLPDPELATAIGQAAARTASAAGISGRPVPAPRLHLTVLFLGDVDAAIETRACRVAAQALGEAFDLTLDQAGSFRRAQVLWIGPRTTPPALQRLWQQLHNGLADVAAGHSRGTLAPHVTCLRHVDRPLPLTPIAPLAWPVRRFALVHSELGPNPRYHVVSHWPLQTSPRQDCSITEGT